jgi:hypothetical protein
MLPFRVRDDRCVAGDVRGQLHLIIASLLLQAQLAANRAFFCFHVLSLMIGMGGNKQLVFVGRIQIDIEKRIIDARFHFERLFLSAPAGTMRSFQVPVKLRSSRDSLPRNYEHPVMKKALTTPTASLRDFDKRADGILAELQKTLLPEHASDVIGINVDTGEYVLAHTSAEAWQAFREQWPGTLGYVVRVDGGPVAKFHGR